MVVRVLQSLKDIPGSTWNELDLGGNPFLSHGFLRSLEVSGSVGHGTGWEPRYLLLEEDGVLQAAVPAYYKTDSYGEYIFDWSWASASQRAGFPYYPKLVVAVPFTPATGRRILIRRGLDSEARDDRVSRAAKATVELAKEEGCHSIHWLFVDESERAALRHSGFLLRDSVQFHWRNREYKSFDDFLSTFTSRKRKQVRKERRRSCENLDGIEFVEGPEITQELCAELDMFYRINVARHGGMDYLRPGFFEALLERCPDNVLYARAHRKTPDGSQAVAGALFLRGKSGLYGRYWGATEDHEFLHFEVAYYAAIERCIEQGVTLFEAGAQGQHKLLRGFEPTRTSSAHMLFHKPLESAVERFLIAESEELVEQMAKLAELGPYKAQ